jgi:hypothetical protein
MDDQKRGCMYVLRVCSDVCLAAMLETAFLVWVWELERLTGTHRRSCMYWLMAGNKIGDR